MPAEREINMPQPEVATGGLNPGDVSFPARAFTRQHGARFRLGEITAVGPAARRITLADGAELGYGPCLG